MSDVVCEQCQEGPFRGDRGLRMHRCWCRGHPEPWCGKSSIGRYVKGKCRCGGCRLKMRQKMYAYRHREGT